MVNFVCDNPETEDILRRLHRQVIGSGGLVYDGLTIHCENGNLTVTCDSGKPENERIMVLPNSCLLPLERFDLKLESNHLIIAGYDEGIPAEKVAMMQTMLDLFEATDKVKASTQQTTLGLFYHDRELFNRIFDPFFGGKPPFFDKLVLMAEDAFTVDSLFKNRVFGFKNFESQEGVTKVVMPLMDLINHHPMAHGFHTDFSYGDDLGSLKAKPEDNLGEDARYDGISVVKSCPVEGSDECFVRYSNKDAMNSFVHYDFVEKNAPFVRSMPLEFDIPDVGRICVLGREVPPEDLKLPSHVKDLRLFMPSIALDKVRKTLVLSSVLIPQERAPRALRRMLAHALESTGMVTDEARLTVAVWHAEREIIGRNLEYYESLQQYLVQHKTIPGTEKIVGNAREMASVQLGRIKNYPFFAEAMGAESVAVSR